MTNIHLVKDITSEEVQKLNAQCIKTVDDWWKRVGEEGFTALAQEVGIGAQRMMKLLAQQAINEDEGRTENKLWRGWALLKRNWLLLFLGLLLVLAAFLIIGAFSSSGTVVIAAASLAPLEVVEEGDLKTKQAFRDESASFEAVRDVVGRYTLQAIPKGGVLDNSQFTSFTITDVEPAEMTNRSIISLSVQPPPLAAKSLGHNVDLLFSPRAANGSSQPAVESLILEDVIILSIKVTDDSARIVAAVGKEDLEAVAKRLGASDIYILPSVP